MTRAIEQKTTICIINDRPKADRTTFTRKMSGRQVGENCTSHSIGADRIGTLSNKHTEKTRRVFLRPLMALK